MRAGPKDVWEQFHVALDGLGLETHLEPVTAAGSEWDAKGSIEGVDVAVAVRVNPTTGDVLRLAQQNGAGAYKVLASRHLWTPAREVATAHGVGFFDGRGHLRLWHRPLLVDTAVPVVGPAPVNGSRWRLDSPSALDVALAVLDGTAVSGVRTTASAIGRSPGTVSKQLAALRSRYLVDDSGEPLVPALFEAVLDEWHPAHVPLAGTPSSVAGATSEGLGIRFDDLDAEGWVLADTAAASAWGAPVVTTVDSPPAYYAPNASSVAKARALFGDATYGQHASTVAVAPCPYVCRRRVDRSANGQPLIAPSPVVAALDLASDPARGREILELWSRDLPPEVTRVW